mgnify:CR=1 FL=1
MRKNKKVYYFIHYLRKHNTFQFKNLKLGIDRSFLNFRSALNFFDYVDSLYGISKHIKGFVPTKDIPDIHLVPYETPCALCGRVCWSYYAMRDHIARCEKGLSSREEKTIKKSKIVYNQFSLIKK